MPYCPVSCPVAPSSSPLPFSQLHSPAQLHISIVFSLDSSPSAYLHDLLPGSTAPIPNTMTSSYPPQVHHSPPQLPPGLSPSLVPRGIAQILQAREDPSSAGQEEHSCSLSFPWGSSEGFFHPWPFLLSFPLPSLRLLHRFVRAVDGKKGNGAKLLPGTTGSRAPAIRPRSAGLAASRAGFLCCLCEPFLPAIDIGFPAQGHFQGCKSAVLLYLVFLFSLRGFQTCWRSQLLCMATMPSFQQQALCCPLLGCPGVPQQSGHG